jgi:hypothetical protein
LADDVSLQCQVNLWPVAGLVRHRAQRRRRPALCVLCKEGKRELAPLNNIVTWMSVSH